MPAKTPVMTDTLPDEGGLPNFTMADLKPSAPIKTAQMGEAPIGMGQTIDAPIFEMTTWYHSNGTTSELPAHLDHVYGVKRDFSKTKPAGWDALANAYIQCPMVRCTAIIRLTDQSDDDALAAVGIDPTPDEDRKKNAILSHYKRAHELQFADMMRRGVITSEQARYL